MNQDHITTEFLRRVSSGEAPLAELFVRTYEHLRSVCPECAQAVERYAEETEARVLAEQFDPLPKDRLPRLNQVIQGQLKRVKELREGVAEVVDEYLAMPEEEAIEAARCGEVERCNPLVVDRLLAVSRDRVTSDPDRAEAVARLAEEVTLHMPLEDFGVDLANDLLLRCQINRANALRAGRDLQRAEELVRRSLVDRTTSSDPLVHGEILRVAASLRRTQGRLEEALAHADEAVSIYRQVGDTHLEGKSLLGRAYLHQMMHRSDQALKDLQHASALIDRTREPYLELCAHHNLAWYLCDLGRFGEARTQLSLTRDLYKKFSSPILPLRRQWLEGRIARGLGRLEEAESLFRGVQKGFLGQKMLHDVTLVSLDLALLLAEAGRTAELQELSVEMVAWFQAQGIHTQAMASLVLFQQAASAEVVTLGLIRDLSTHFEAMFNKPRGELGRRE